MGGSSLGGLIALHLASAHRDTFGLCAAVSPAVWWADRGIVQSYAEGSAWLKDTRFWVDIATREGRPGEGEGVPGAVLDARALVEILSRAGLERGRGYDYLEVPGGEHNEAAWAARLDRVLLFLFGKK